MISPGETTEERMQCSFSKATRTIQKWAAVLTVVAAAGAANMSAGRADEANAKSLLKAMSDYLAAQKAISFDYDSNLELVSTQQQKIALASSGALTLNRPDKLHATRTGGFANIEMVFDGKALTLLGKNANLYASSRGAGHDRSTSRPVAGQISPAGPRRRFANVGSLQRADAGG
jgi:hypothetical protein